MGGRVVYWGGRTLLWLVGIVMMLSGAANAFGFAPEQVVQSLQEVGILPWQRIIGVGALATGALLMFRLTLPLGVLSASSFWGGAILTHMAKQESFVPPAVLLVFTWIGGLLLLVSLLRSSASDPASSAPAESVE